MENRNSSLWIGLGIGTVIGTLAYRFSRTSKAKKLKEKVCNVFHKITGQTEDLLDEAKEKVADTGKVVVDKVADKVQDGADAVKDALKDAKKDVKQGAEKAKTEIKEGYEDVKKNYDWICNMDYRIGLNYQSCSRDMAYSCAGGKKVNSHYPGSFDQLGRIVVLLLLW